ncbi:RNase H domain-containing protein [Trichonephila clavipes]|nr:RNase H domain-containing protein [Trichonephila clavipes]
MAADREEKCGTAPEVRRPGAPEGRGLIWLLHLQALAEQNGVTPTHPWYNRQAPGGALSIKADRVVQTTISRLASGHIRGLSFNLGQKIYENCTKCNLVQATPDHLLFCAGLEREDIYSNPLLVYDFLRTLGLMDLV